MEDLTQSVADSWSVLRRTPAEADIPCTMNAVEAFERLQRVLVQLEGDASPFVMLYQTKVPGEGQSSKNQTRWIPEICRRLLDQQGHMTFEIFEAYANKAASGRATPVISDTLEDAIEAAFHRVAKAVASELATAEEAVQRAEQALHKERQLLMELSHLKKYMGSFDPNQPSLLGPHAAP